MTSVSAIPVSGTAAPALAMYGGTFDPIHFGHLRSAIEVGEVLGVKTTKLLPSFIPPHRSKPETETEHRLQMLNLAVQNIKSLDVDTRELDRAGTSYTIDTLKTFRDDLGAHTPLYLVIGLDAYLLLHEWHEWQKLTDLAHLVIIERPGYEKQEPQKAVKQWAENRLAKKPRELKRCAAGSVCRIKLRQMDISATMIREALKENLSVDCLLPDAVIKYIRQNKLYRHT